MDNVVEIGQQKKKLKRAEPNSQTSQMFQDVRAFLEAFNSTGYVMFLEQAKEALDELVERVK